MAEFEALLTAKAEWKPHQIAKAGDISALAEAATNLAEIVKSSLELARNGMEVVKLLAALQNINPILVALDKLADEVLKQIHDLKEAGYWYLYVDPYFKGNVTGTHPFDYGFEQLRNEAGKRYWQKKNDSGNWIDTTTTPEMIDLDQKKARPKLVTPKKLIAGGYNWFDPLPDPLEGQSKFPQFSVKNVINEFVKAFDDEGDVPRYRKNAKDSDLPKKDDISKGMDDPEASIVYDIDGNPFRGWDPAEDFGLELFDMGKRTAEQSRWPLDYEASRKPINTRVAKGKPNILGNTEFDGGSGAIAIIIAADNFDKFASVFNEFSKMFSDIPEFSADQGQNLLNKLKEIITPNDVKVNLTQVDTKYEKFVAGDIISGKRYGSLGEIRSVNSSATTATSMKGQKVIKVIDDLGEPLKDKEGNIIEVLEEIDLNPDERWVDMEIMVKPMRGVDGYNPWTPGDTVLEMEKRGNFGNSEATTAETGIDYYDNYVMVGAETVTLPKNLRVYPKIGKVLVETLQVLPDSTPPDFDGILIKDIVPGWGEFFQELENFVKQIKGMIIDSTGFIQEMINMLAQIEEFLEHLIKLIDKFLEFFRITLPSSGVFALYIPNQNGGNEGLKKEIKNATGIPDMGYASGILFIGTEGDKLIAGGGSKNPIDLLALVLGLLN
tara:strand:- start:29 stop:2020 length:1992 start_codon:yes stop_codon:yes gene_type:complete